MLKVFDALIRQKGTHLTSKYFCVMHNHHSPWHGITWYTHMYKERESEIEKRTMACLGSAQEEQNPRIAIKTPK